MVFFQKCPNPGLAVLLLKHVFAHVLPDESIIYDFQRYFGNILMIHGHAFLRGTSRRHFAPSGAHFPPD
jgi:hypothetical protein